MQELKFENKQCIFRDKAEYVTPKWIIEVGKLLNTFFWFINHIKTKICLLYLLTVYILQKNFPGIDCILFLDFFVASVWTSNKFNHFGKLFPRQRFFLWQNNGIQVRGLLFISCHNPHTMLRPSWNWAISADVLKGTINTKCSQEVIHLTALWTKLLNYKIKVMWLILTVHVN